MNFKREHIIPNRIHGSGVFFFSSSSNKHKKKTKTSFESSTGRKNHHRCNGQKCIYNTRPQIKLSATHQPLDHVHDTHNSLVENLSLWSLFFFCVSCTHCVSRCSLMD